MSNVTTNRTASPHELLRLFPQAGVFHFDATGVYNTSISDLNWSKLDQYFTQYNVDFSKESDKERLLVNTDLMTSDGELTVAGLLIFGVNPQKYLYNASISRKTLSGYKKLVETVFPPSITEGSLILFLMLARHVSI